MKYKVGDRIVYLEESTQKLMKRELPGEITAVNDDGTYNLKLDDGRKIEAVDGIRIAKWTQPNNTTYIINEVEYICNQSGLTHQALIDLYAEVSIHKDLFKIVADGDSPELHNVKIKDNYVDFYSNNLNYGVRITVDGNNVDIIRYPGCEINELNINKVEINALLQDKIRNWRKYLVLTPSP